MKLFISYARVDKPLCKQVVEHLTAVHDVWYDRRLHAGQDWWNEIQARLDWCEGFVYLLSPESVASEYCQKEFALAVNAGKHIFPVLIQARTEIPKSLSHIHYADLSQGMEDIITLLNAVTVAERQQRTPTPAPQPKVEKPQQPPKNVSPNYAITEAADAIENGNFDHAVFLLKQAQGKETTERMTRIIVSMLKDAEDELERQAYLREAQREYAPIVELVKRERTRTLGCEAFKDFQQHFPDYDPDGVSEFCKPSSTIPKRLRSVDIMPTPFSWITIPAGKVTLKTEKGWAENYIPQGETRTFDVSTFEIAKYPITNAQFAKFIVAKGYEESKWWTEAGWKAREKGWHYDGEWKPSGKAWTEPRYWRDKTWNGAEQPVIGVSWYESVAFCNWLSVATGENIMLPTEQQWQRAAQGDDGRKYPWGNDWDCELCNNSVTQCDSKVTTPVRKYEDKGDSYFKVVDMAGNVWE